MDVHSPVISTDKMLRLVSDRRRRRLLRLLADRGDGELTDLADAIADDGASSGGAAREASERVETKLYHVHLPLLADHGLVEFDSRSGTVRYRAHDDIEKQLRFVGAEME